MAKYEKVVYGDFDSILEKLNDAVMSGQGLQNIKTVGSSGAYVSEDAPDLSDGKQFIQFVWDEPIAFDQVVLYSQYCGTDSTEGQAPTAFDIQVSENGADGWTLAVSSGAIAWEAGDEVQFHTVQLDRQTGVKGVRVVITDANLDWGHYAVYELEINDAPETSVPSPDTGEDGRTLLLIGVMACALTAALWEMGLLSQPPAIVPEGEERFSLSGF